MSHKIISVIVATFEEIAHSLIATNKVDKIARKRIEQFILRGGKEEEYGGSLVTFKIIIIK